MQTTFISIHDLSPDARILYTSDSVIDLLGYTPDEIVNRSCWDFFSQDEVPYARKYQQAKVSMDKAAVLAYCSVRNKEGDYIGCECCFTICYDVMIVCTSIYQRGDNSQKRAIEAPIVRRLFTSSPQDPRYHMLSHISAKFAQPYKPQAHEPRAALFLNRFTRTLSIMYATAGLEEVIGIPAETMRGRSFYYCIAENCLQDAVKCLENAKGNDSIAYLRFWFRDPRLDDPTGEDPDDDSDEEMTTDMSVDDEPGGVQLGEGAAEGDSPQSDLTNNSNPLESSNSMEVDDEENRLGQNSRTSSGDSAPVADSHEAIFGRALRAESSASSLPMSPSPERERARPLREPIELEAVISCTSDGLVVCLRRARPMIPHPTQRPSKPMYANGLFAAPWAAEPMLPPIDARPRAGFGGGFAPSLGPQGAHRDTRSSAPVGGPEQQDFMNAIRDQAIFAWALTGINGSLAEFGQGRPKGHSLPMGGLPVWASDPRQSPGSDRSSNGGFQSGAEMFGSASRSPAERSGHRLFGDPGLDRSGGRGSGFSSGNAAHSAGGSTPYG